MNFSNEIYEELNSISTLLAGIEKHEVFSVPEGYFQIFPIDLFKKINSTFTGIKTGGLSVPEGYFDNLSTSILNKIKLQQDDPAQELKNLSPMLYSIQGENVFGVPSGYFRNLENDILYRINPPAKVVTLKKRDSVWRYAAAAIVTGFIGVSALMTFNSSRLSNPGIVNEQPVSSAIRSASDFKNELQVKAAIATLSDDEIIKYLEKTGKDEDGEVLATGIDGNTLPAQKDYLMDENTLETYLEKADKKSQN